MARLIPKNKNPILVGGASLGGGAGAEPKSAIVKSQTGVVYTIQRLLGSTSTLSLLSGSNSNITISDNRLSATAAIAPGQSQTVRIREGLGSLAVEYPISLTGQAVTPIPTPAPVFTTNPSITPSSGAVGSTFTANDGVASDATVYTRRWLLGATQIGTGSTVVPASAGSLTLEVTATGPGGSATRTSAASTVTGSVIAPGYRVNYLDDQGASAGLWYGASATPAWVYDSATDRVLGVVQRFNYNAGSPLKENTAVIYDRKTKKATVAGVIMTDDGTIVGSADQHGVGTLVKDNFGFWHSFGGGHNAPMKHSVSTDGGVSWVANGSVGTTLTYSHPHMVGNVLYMIARKAPGGGTYPLVIHRSNSIDSTTGSTSFSGEIVLIDLQSDTRVYAGTTVVVGTKIYIPFTRASADDTVRRDLYVAVYDTANGSLSNLDGSVVITAANLPLTRTVADASFRLVDQGTTEESNTPTMVITAEGIHLLYQGGATGTSYLYQRRSLAGALLEGPTAIGYAAPYRYSTPNIGPLPGGGVEVLFPSLQGAVNDFDTVSPFTRGGNIYRTTRPSGASAWTAPELVMATTPVHPLDSVTPVVGGPADFRFAFAERAIDDNDFTTGANLRTYGWGSDGLVTTPMVEDADAKAFIGSEAYSDEDREIVNAYFRGIKATGWWERGDRAYLMAEPVESIARKDVFGRSNLTDTAAGNTHVPRSGLKPSASSKFTTAFNPSTDANKKLSNTAINLCIVPYEDTQSTSSDLGTTAATASLTLGGRSTSNNVSTLLADTTSTNRTGVSSSRMLHMSQRAGNRKELYVRSKTPTTAATVTAGSLPNGNLTLGGNSTGFSQRGLGYAHIGQSIDAGPVMQVIKRYTYQRMGLTG